MAPWRCGISAAIEAAENGDIPPDGVQKFLECDMAYDPDTGKVCDYNPDAMPPVDY